ncbi:hypothetical protein BN946_scf184884.g44 [Trametes cinnabarina]|uniref:BBC1/AIM3 cysteine proteinase-fold domain-containing protein n=1 Tax=Pycnoporus cinnabarinus TaxID=5643 RepID=A0A060S6B2_PYCCI|nr:hypothetical protein BN946_scf184884.g44 [Trametes cinnabarina]
MSDPPPKKVSSLRDRIAAFENKGSAPAPAPPPAPRPKPGHINWKPKPVSPPTSPKATPDEAPESRKTAGMSAADAKEAIGKLSLKERMAALQGSAAFAAPVAPPPRPSGDKPKWKPPPVVQKVEPIGGDDDEPGSGKPATEDKPTEGDAAAEGKAPEEGGDKEGEQEEKEDGEPDPEEEERQRRAALAAKMARLGGARIGMAPPIFGRKPDIPPKKLSKPEEQPKTEKPAEQPSAPEVTEAPAVIEPKDDDTPASTDEGAARTSAEYFPPQRKDSAASSTLSPGSAATSPPVRSPAMPVPQVPKRAAPPRKRPTKSPSPAPQPVIDQQLQESPASLPPATSGEQAPIEAESAPNASEAEASGPRGDREPELTEGQVEKLEEQIDTPGPAKEAVDEQAEMVVDSAAVSEPAVEQHAAEPLEPAPEKHIEEKDEKGPVEEKHEEEPVEDRHDEEPEAVITGEVEELKHKEHEAAPEAPAEAATEELAEEEDEAARRKRIAERIAKSGGFNPFGGGMPPPPPVRRESTDSVRSVRSPLTSPPPHPPIPVRRDSHQDSTKSPTLHATSPREQVPERKASVGSVRSEVAEEAPMEENPQDDRDDHAAATEDDADTGDEDADTRVPASANQGAAHEEALSEVAEDEEAETRAEHEDVHTHVDELVHEAAKGDNAESDDHQITTHEKQEDVADEPQVAHHPREVARSPTLPPTDDGARAPVEQPAPPPVVSPPPPPKRLSLPPPPRVAPPPPVPAPEDDVDKEAERVESPQPGEEEETYAMHAREVGPEHEAEELSPHEDAETLEDEEQQDAMFERHATETPEGGHALSPPPPTRHIPIPARFISDDEDEGEQEGDFDAPPLPPQPPHRPSLNVPPPPTRAPPQSEDKDITQVYDEPAREREEAGSPPPPLPPPRHARLTSPSVAGVPPSRPIPPPLRQPSEEEDEHEVLNESDVDPIDPEFYSPQRSAGSVSSPPPPPSARIASPPPSNVPQPHPRQVVSPPPPPPQRVISPPPVAAPERVTAPVEPVDASPAPAPERQSDKEEEEDAEAARRRTIAERMAKLGGIRFGAPPQMPAIRRPPPPPEPEHEEGGEHAEGEGQAETEAAAPEEEEAAPEEEEDEFARKQRIAARIAGMGGMRFGMLPGVAPPVPRPPVRRQTEGEEPARSPSPPKRSAPVAAPPPPPPAQHEEERGDEEDYHHVSDSEGAAHEESELEEARRQSLKRALNPLLLLLHHHLYPGPAPPRHPHSLILPLLRQPLHRLRTRLKATSSSSIRTRTRMNPRHRHLLVRPDHLRVMCHPPPSHPAPVAQEAPEGRGEQPGLPHVDFGSEADLSLSGQWSEDSTNYPSASASKSSALMPQQQQTPKAPAAHPFVEQQMTPEELMAHWGRVGVQVHEVAAAMYERSKKTVVGDGSYLGFVTAVLGQVPNAAQPAHPFESFGYLVYSQVSAAVQRRVSDIMPGDVLVVEEAKFKGHKGLQSYHQTVGVGQPLIAVIGDFEPKKSKVKVFQANQHVGQQSVESASYRLEDLKSGTVKIFRVLEA